MEQLANSIVAAKTFDDVTAIMRAEIGSASLWLSVVWPSVDTRR
jgi:hypothetical protein